MTETTFEEIAHRFRALGEPMRVKILYYLGHDELTVTELVERCGCSQSNVSKHLSNLLRHGLVNRRPEGTSAYYSVADKSIFNLCDQICGGIERDLAERSKAFE